MLTPDLIAEGRRLEAAATPGPWLTEKPPKDADGWATGVVVAATARGQALYATPPGGSFPESDRQLIAFLRNHTAALLDAADAERRLRELLAGCYGGAALYADDGELQDNREHPTIDFLRDPVEIIDAKMRERARAALAGKEPA